MNARHLLLFLAMIGLQTAHAQSLIIERQGLFAAGGTTLQREGEYDNSRFVGWSEQVETGQSYRADHAFVSYQVPAGARPLSLVYVHGFGGSGTCWLTTPDGRDGFATLMLRRGWSSYVVDLPGRGRAGRTTATTTVAPVANEMFWFDIWRMGVWPEWNDGVQFPKDSAALEQFFRALTPDVSNHMLDVPALNAVMEHTGDAVLVTHSAGGMPGWMTAMQSPHVKGVAAYEPGGFVFPEGEVPERIDGLTGGVAGVPVPMEQFLRLTQMPIVIYFGDYIPEEPSTLLGDENWRVRLQMARRFVAAVNAHGGQATLVELPKIGIRGNTHFLMQERNNDVLADLLSTWILKNLLPSTTMNNVLTTRQQHLVAVAALEAKGDIATLSARLDTALDDGMTLNELKEALSHLYAYTGFPRSLNALGALDAVAQQRAAAGKTVVEGADATPLPSDYDALAAGTRVQAQLTANDHYRYAFAPATDYYLKAHLFGDIFARDILSFADRELVTIGALSALDGVEAQRRSHMSGSMNMGVTPDMLRSIPLVLQEKVGTTEALRAAATVNELLGDHIYISEQQESHALPTLTFGRGAANDAYAQYFSGQSYLEVKSSKGDPIGISNVTFEPGCRNNWHIHHATTGGGQVLICVEGEGWYQKWGKPAQSLKAGDVVEIPAGVKHWHGAKRDSWFSHYAFHIPGTDASNEWLEAVSDEQYDALEMKNEE